jgi:arabinofuranan 3-O-arabinosyltransferase
MWGYAAILAALAFAQSPGRIVPDTKYDLVAAPYRFLQGATRMWDPGQAFGTLGNQAYGYLWPMGPFFVLGKASQVPEWIVQRLWWLLLLWLAFYGVVRLCRELRVGAPWAQVTGAFMFVLAPRMTSLLGETSVELWPTALAPWVLIPLVRGSREGSVRRAAALSALAVACCGGVNATAVSAVLPLGVLWILTREGGPRKWRLFGWWTLFTVVVSLWWLVPLVQLGRYSPPFLDYIENSFLTSAPTGLLNSLMGTSNWVSYLAPASYPAGAVLISTPFLLLDAAALAALGVAGLALRDHPERRFLVWGLLVGLVLVGFGYAGDLHGWFGATRQGLLDESLSPLRNTHKYDVVVRMSLALGLVHLLSHPPVPARLGRYRPATLLQATAVVAVLGLTSPWIQGVVAAPGGFASAPGYWDDAADYLQRESGATAVEIPAAAFGDYTWGSTHDDVLQGTQTSPWAVRNVIPLAQPGNVVWLDALTEQVERGLPSDDLAPKLRGAGVDLLVVRNDLARLTTGSPDPALLQSVLEQSLGLTRVASFGPDVGQEQGGKAPDGARFLNQGGFTAQLPSIEIYRVDATVGSASLLPDGASLMGDPGTVAPDGSPFVLTADLPPDDVRRVVLTDRQRRRALALQAVRSNASATLPEGSLPRRSGPEQFHRYLVDQERWQTTESWTGVTGVGASSSQGFADAAPPLERGAHPGAALDGDRRTEWSTARQTLPDAQWWEVQLTRPTAVSLVKITTGRDSVAVPQLRLSAGSASTTVPAPPPGETRTYPVSFPAESSLRVTAVAPEAAAAGSWSLAEVDVSGVDAQRWLTLPKPPAGSVVDHVVLRRDLERTACPSIQGTVICRAFLGSHGDDGDWLARRFAVTSGGDYSFRGTASLRRGARLVSALADLRGVKVSATAVPRADAASRPQAMTDGDPGTTWVAPGSRPTIALTWDEPTRVDSLDLVRGENAPASAPSEVTVTAGRRTKTVDVGKDGHVELPGWRTKKLKVLVESVDPVTNVEGGTGSVLPAGVSELRVNGAGFDEPGQVRSFPCGSGPHLRIGGTVYPTGVDATVSDLLRGASVPLRVCGEPSTRLVEGDTEVVASPSSLFRVDGLDLSLTGSETSRVGGVQGVPLTRDGDDAPTEIGVPARGSASTLVLAQNFNDGWRAELDGTTLEPQRVDGWQQGWRLPEGAGGTVHLTYTPQKAYATGLVVGAVGVLLVLLAALLPPRRRRRTAPLPSLVPGPGGLVDGVLAVGAAGLLTGWWGAGCALVAVFALRRVGRESSGAVGLVAGGLLFLAAVPRVAPSRVDSLTDALGQDVVGTATQAACAVSLALLLWFPGGTKGPRFFSRSTRRSNP